MRFTIPQFIEYEAKIVGPLTFKQFIFVGLAGATAFVLYFMVPFSIFLISCFALGGIALAFAFLKIGGRSFSTVLGSFLKFILSPKIYLWKKKESPVKVFIKKEKPKEEEEKEEELPLKIAEKSQLKRIKTQIETRAR
ncbi:MAG: PrgI family protein [Candidatus Paceibacterales bacterium]